MVTYNMLHRGGHFSQRAARFFRNKTFSGIMNKSKEKGSKLKKKGTKLEKKGTKVKKKMYNTHKAAV